MIEVRQVNLFELLDDVRKGLIVIPDFQRDFIWELKQIEELLNSVINGYFIGSILLLESSLDNQRFAPRLIRGVQQDQINRHGHNTIKYILDGQQRITSLYYSFFEPNVALSDDMNFVCKFYIRPDVLDIFGLLDPEDIVRRLRVGRELKDKLFEIYNSQYGVDIKYLPTIGIFKNKETFEAYINSNSSLTKSYVDKLREIFDKIQRYTIPVITLPTGTSDENIVNTFERINRTGTPLNIFELAVARYYPIGINLNTLKNRIKDRPFLDVLDEVSILKVMALLKDLEPKSQNILRLVDVQNSSPQVLAEFNNLWECAVGYLDVALDRVRRVYGAVKIKIGKKNIELIPYTTMIVPLAVMLYEIEKRGNLAALYNKVDLWYWSTVFSQKYSHAADTKSFSDVKVIQNWFANPQKKPDLTPNFDYVKSEMLKGARSSALGKGFYNQLILNNPMDLLTGQPITISECQVDHILPSSRFGRAADNIFNLTLLDKNTNQKKKDKLPSDFLNDCLLSHGNDTNSLIRTLESHYISAKALESLKQNNLDGFIQARGESFIGILKGKLTDN
ncbi:DUF262 domain-containing protein [Bacteroidetes/Chlorobi group bacterium ChocPot_Mid]|nr:MAG: DUF262 domain-containing protein [Bacteroidetes/Chlorobi group bacterium ChocPot_Mid]